MRPDKVNNSQEDLFKNRLSNQLNPKHELLLLSSMIPWEQLGHEFADLFAEKSALGRPAKPVRLIVGLLLLQHMHNLSDAEVVRSWVENPYWQYFCGYDFIQWELPINPSSLTRWRKRLGAGRLEKILSMTVSVAVESGTIAKKDLETVIFDTTVMPKNIEFPTDAKLLEKARVQMVKLAAEHNIDLRQNYNLVSKKLLRKISGYLHANQYKRAKKAQKTFKTLVGRVMRDCARKLEDKPELQEVFAQIMQQTKHLLERKKSDKDKLYSLHELDVDCISKGKVQKKYEFGCKVSLSVTHKKGSSIITSAQALHGNPYDGHTLASALDCSEKISKVAIKKAFVDRGYRGHGITETEVFISGQRRDITKHIARQIKRRQAIEPHIGHLKNKLKLGLCRLKGIVGDQINAVLTAASYNIRIVLKHLRLLFVQILCVTFCLNNSNKIQQYYIV
jgi:IS5 family transposase